MKFSTSPVRGTVDYMPTEMEVRSYAEGIILKTYKDFLILNKGFVDCSKTNQILIPENVSYNDLELLNEKIQNAISNKKIELLLEEFGKNFNID